MSGGGSRAQQVRAEVTGFADTVQHVRHVLLVSSDGLLTSCSPGLERASGDRLAAIVGSLCALTRGVAQEFGSSRLRQSIIELDDEYLFLMRVDDDAVLAVVAEAEADVATAGGAMAVLTLRLRTLLTAALVPELRSQLPVDGPDRSGAAGS